MLKIAPTMGRKPLGKKKYHFTAHPDLVLQFDKIAADLGTTRSDMIAAMMRERVKKQITSERKEK